MKEALDQSKSGLMCVSGGGRVVRSTKNGLEREREREEETGLCVFFYRWKKGAPNGFKKEEKHYGHAKSTDHPWQGGRGFTLLKMELRLLIGLLQYSHKTYHLFTGGRRAYKGTLNEYSQHLSDNEASQHGDASDAGAAPKQQQQNGNSKKRISTGKYGVIKILPSVLAAEIQAVEKERKAKNILLMAIPKEHMRRFHGMDDAKEIWEAIRIRFGGNA
ncbi:hypothetical protein Tco_1198007, partial [Tanacetum coccineum]